MILLLPNGKNVHLIGDPHLGRKFEVGVPPARKGEREIKQLAHFADELAVPADLVVMVGDLFDTPYVSYDTVNMVANVIRHAVISAPQTTFVMMAGNHDMPRNLTKVGAFHDLKDRLDGRYPNLLILTAPAVVQEVALFPWEWDRRADDQVGDVAAEEAHAAVGHWDLATFNGKDNHLAPVAALREAFGPIPLYSGHYHIPDDYTVEGETVHCIGSLEPYTHGEDPKELYYVTLSRSDALARDDLKDMNVRIRRKRGEDMPEIDCLSLTYIYEEQVDEGATPQPAPVKTHDWSKLVSQSIAPLDQRVQTFIKDRINVDATEEQC